MRGTVAALLLCTAGLLAAGCGASHEALPEPTSADVTKAQLRSFASAVNLRVSDLPGLRLGAGDAVISPTGSGRATPCSAIAGPTSSEEIPSRALIASTWETFSVVGAMPSAELASKFIAAAASPRGRSCLTAEGEGSRATYVSSLSGQFATGGRYAGISEVTPLTEGSPKREHIDIYVFAAGRAVVGLVALGETAPPVVQEREVLSRLHARAEKHAL